MKRVHYIFGAALLLVAALCVAWMAEPSPPRPGSVVRIGINHSPPYAVVRPDGSPDGFSVEVLSEAARRLGLVVQWIVVPQGPDVALRTGQVDIWHLLTDLPDRHDWASFTEPWLRVKFVLVVPEHSNLKTPRDAVGRRISHPGVTMYRHLARGFFPHSRFLEVPEGSELDPVCRGDADAAFLDMKKVVTRLLHRNSACNSFALDIIPIEGASFELAIGATRTGLGAAKALRAEITNMAEDQSLDYLYRKWLRDTTDETRIVNDLTEARQHSRLFRYSAVILAAVVMLLAVLMYRERIVRHALHSSYEFASAVLDTAGGLVFISDRHGRMVHFNRACERATGKSLAEVRSKTSWEVFVPPAERQSVETMFTQLAAGAGHSSHEHHWQTIDGPRLFSWSNTVLLDKAGRVDYIIATGIDISHREAAEQKLSYEAAHDALTNLMNRRQFLKELDAAVAKVQSGGSGFSLVIADLDCFKIINDTHGHESGDDVLVVLARIFRNALGSDDLAGRLGGDEFCLLIRSFPVDSILERIRARLRQHVFRSAAGKVYHADITFGTAAWSDSFHHSLDLLRAADQSLYIAKDHSPSRQTRFRSQIAALETRLKAQPSQFETPTGSDS